MGRPPTLRAVAGIALLVVWMAFLALYALGNDYCVDPATGRSGIDALDHCASHHPLGLPLVLHEDWAFWSFLGVLPVLGWIWWPWRPWRRSG